jgi:predicted nucleic acid-binding protein
MQILADTSVWIGHLRAENTTLKGFLEEGVVLMHPYVRCELALGSMKNRSEILSLLATLPESKIASDEEVLFVIEKKMLWGIGIGWVDAQLLAATRLTQDCSLWTLDGPLRKACEKARAKLFHGTV